VRECSAPQFRGFPLRTADCCLAAMLVLGMLGAAAAQNQVQGALQGQNNGQPIHIEAMTLEIRDRSSNVLRQRPGSPGRHDDEMPNPCRVLRAGRLKRRTQNLQLSTSRQADYPSFGRACIRPKRVQARCAWCANAARAIGSARASPLR
jgi:hypothetical protein